MTTIQKSRHPEAGQSVSFAPQLGQSSVRALPLPGIAGSRDKALLRARQIYEARRRRDQAFEALGPLFHDPYWDILLDLYIASGGPDRVSTSSACVGAAAPVTTALRCLAMLEERGAIESEIDPDDRRRRFVRLTESARAMMTRYLNGLQISAF